MFRRKKFTCANPLAVPEIVDPDHGYHTENTGTDGGGHTCRGSGIFAAPADNTPRGRAIRLHEMAHLRWSPSSGPGDHPDIDPLCLLAVEDGRINYLLSETGASLKKSLRPIKKDIDVISPRLNGMARVLVQIAGFGIVPRKSGSLEDKVFAILKGHKFTFLGTLEAARWLSARRGSQKNGSSKVLDCPHNDDGIAWGKMTVETPPRPLRWVPRFQRSTVRCTDTGVVMRAPHRALIDGKVFRMRPRVQGGTVLVDCSGSMQIESAQLQALLKLAPAAEIAGYAGSATYKRGILRVFVAGGMAVASKDLEFPFAHNIVDGPACEWLASRPGPRIWVTDCQFYTGNLTQPNITLLTALHNTVQQAKIEIVGSVTEALTLFGGTA